MSENPKPAENPETPAAPAAPDNSVLIAAALDANRRAQSAENRAALAIDAAHRAEAAAAANRPRPVDPLQRLVSEDLTLSPEQKHQLLGRAINDRAAAMTGRAVQGIREENARERVAMQNETALNTVLASRPELQDPSNGSKFAAAMSKVKFELEATGQPFSAAQLAQRAVVEYDRLFKNPGEKPPFIEGSNNPSLGGLPAAQVPNDGLNELEDMYDMKKGQIQPGYNPKDEAFINKMNNDYVQAKNGPMFKAGAVTNVQAIIRGIPPA